MKIEIERLVIENDQPKEIKLFGVEYMLHPKGAGVIEVKLRRLKLPRKRTGAGRSTGGLDLGKKVKFHKGVNIFKNPLEQIRQAETQTDINNILKKYHPKVKPMSIKRYSDAYKSYLKGQKTVKIKFKRHKRRRPVPDTFGFSKKYQTWAKNDEVQKIKNAINTVRLDYKPTAVAIAKETNLSKSRVRAVLDVLLSKGIVIKRHEGLTPIYQIPYIPST